MQASVTRMAGVWAFMEKKGACDPSVIPPPRIIVLWTSLPNHPTPTDIALLRLFGFLLRSKAAPVMCYRISG